jgi:phosphatidylglycerophosphatase A
MVLWFNNYCSSNKQTCFLIILLCFGDGICSSYVWILNTRDMQQPVVDDVAANCPTLLSSPLLVLLCLAAVAPFCFADDEIV